MAYEYESFFFEAPENMFAFIKQKFFTEGTRTLAEWQETSFTVIFSLICVLAVPVLFRSLLQAFNDGLYMNLFLYSACYLMAVFVTFTASVPFRVKALAGTGLLVAAGLIAVFSVGPMGSGRIFLFASGIFATVMLGVGAGLAVVAFQAAALFAYAYLLSADFPNWANIDLYTSSAWVTSSTTFVFLSLLFVVAIGRMMGGLGATFSLMQEANAKLRKSENRFETVVGNANDIIFEVDAQTGLFTYVSATCKSLLGYDKEEVVGMSFQRFLHPDYISQGERLLGQSLEHGTVHDEIEYRILHKNGAWRWHLTKGGPLRDGEGRIIGFVGISRDVTERKEIEQELIRARDEADAATRAKSEFLANMSHEIRTPLNGVMGMLQLMQLSGLDQEQAEYAETGLESCRRLVRLLTDILDFSRIEARMLNIKSGPVDLGEVLSQTGGLFFPIARDSGVELRLALDPDIPDVVYGDGARLQQVLTNLVGNALKFTPAGSVTVEASLLSPLREGRCRVLFSVTDTGIGIPDDKLDSLFRPFSQVSEGYTRNYQGAGLGLSICKRLVGLMGGNISVVSEQGVGTAVYFSLSFDVEGAAEAAQPKRPQHSARILDGMRLLLVEDDHFSTVLAAKLFNRHGAAVRHAGDGREALEALLGSDFDVVLMDIQMPGMDGIEATRAIRRGEAGDRMRRVPIVAMTAYAMRGDRERFLEAGMDGYVSKPFDIDDLLWTIEDIMMRKVS